MASDNSHVSSAALIGLENDLTQLSHSLHEIYELMEADMSNVSEFWRDPKYDEFVAGYRPVINKCEEISTRYGEWCKKVLEPTIEKVIEIETADVGGGGSGSGVGIGGASAGSSSSSDTGNVAPEKSLAAKFNMGTKKVKELNKAATTPGPQGSGASTPQNERSPLSPQGVQIILNGKQR